ncbi:Carbohydrate kinase domain-containing protein [Papilio machaon]|uniref:ATP-dependent (S)-NAD(P)H-hydrate dehydratase n=1 Tax=Papilio machaon TaxID=76193 RepID=A0A0N0PB69_PAPMA|nr:Carbohydrate kinase domain-containing protein [Papilio machaon]
MDKASMIQKVKSCIPPLDGNSHKGQAGRIGIIGGSLEYTGAPYFAGISALKVGADLVHVFCTSSAATVIKSYSPELIVHPLLDQPNAVNDISPWLDRLHAIVIGPGLGRQNKTFEVVSELIKTIKSKSIPLVIDADGLFLITQNLDIIRNFNSPVILTPNKIEFERLCEKVKGYSELNKLGENIIVFKKGQTDEIFCASNVAQWKLNEGGSGRRCGGQGDILSGSIATFLHWMTSKEDKLNMSPDDKSIASSMSCYAASILVRKCNEKAFRIYGRSMVAGDMIEFIHEAFQELYGE